MSRYGIRPHSDQLLLSSKLASWHQANCKFHNVFSSAVISSLSKVYVSSLPAKCITLHSPVVTICTASLTFINFTFCPHSVFMCFVWISEQTAIISLHSVNWLVFLIETESVYCAVRTGSLCRTEVTAVPTGPILPCHVHHTWSHKGRPPVTTDSTPHGPSASWITNASLLLLKLIGDTKHRSTLKKEFWRLN